MKRLCLLLPAVLAALAGVVAVSDAAKPPSCLRGGAALVAADGPVRVVRIARKPGFQRTRVDSIVACWAPTGRRATVFREEDFGDDLRTTSRVEIVDRRWVGALIRYEGGVSESLKALVFDARGLKQVHESRACNGERGDRSGVDDAAFLPGGGLAFSCNQLFLFRTAAGDTPTELEPAGTDVRNLAVATNHADFRDRLYWTVATGPTGDTLTAKSLALGS